MFQIGCHLSSSGGFLAMGKTALEIGANTFAFFTRNPRGGKAKEIDKADADNLLDFCQKNSFGKIVAHAPYTMNLCSSDEGIRLFALNMLKDDLQRMEFIPGNYYNFHPGSHTGQGVEQGISQISSALVEALPFANNTVILLETMAGKGSEIGKTFEEIQEIISCVNNYTNFIYSEKIGVCLDTCHVYDAGYDIVNNFDEIINEFDKIIGLSKLKAVHLNDSMNPLGSHKDRHACLGHGCIGFDAIKRIVKDSFFANIPFILETPNDLPGYATEIKLIKEIF